MIVPQHQDRLLRQQLEEITGRFLGERAGEQIGQIAELSTGHPHHIVLAAAAVPGERDTFSYTCFEFALGLRPRGRQIEVIASRHGDVFVGADFIRHLTATVLHEMPAEKATDDDIIVYSDGDTIRHAGLVRGNKIESKWGPAHRWEHGIWEVPASYGSQLRFFAPIDADQVRRQFVAYAVGLLGSRRVATLIGPAE